jgi:uncharacterized protein YjgD (DUF1641 family)
MKKYVPSLLETFELLENVKQAEKILSQHNIPLEGEYLEFKSEITKTNMVGYLGPIVRMVMGQTQGKEFKKALAEIVLQNIKDNKQHLKSLSKPIHEYEKAMDFLGDIYDMKNQRKLTKFANMLSNRELRNLIKGWNVKTEVPVDFLESVLYFIEKMDSQDQKEFLVKSSKHKAISDLSEALKTSVESHKTGFNFKNITQTIGQMDSKNLEIKYQDPEREILLVLVRTFAGSQAIGSKSWCIVSDEANWNNYTENGENFQFFLFDFNNEHPNLNTIAFTLDGRNDVTACHDRYDNKFGDVISHLNKLGIREKVYTINSRERAKRKVHKQDPEKYDSWLTKEVDGKGKDISKVYRGTMKLYEFQALGALIKTIVDTDFSEGNHLDLLFKKFEYFPIQQYNTHKGYLNNTAINVFKYLSSGYDAIPQTLYYRDGKFDGYDANQERLSKPQPQLLTNLFTKAINSQIPMQRGTRMSILYFLKDQDVDVLRLTQQAKEKRGEELGDREVADLIKRGDDMKPRIQNKLAAIRRGEDAGMNTAEINYALDNGYADILKRYYAGAIPSYGERQLDYEDMQVYSKLGLLDHVGKVIVHKGNMYGVDALNSIEKSLFDRYGG